MKRSFSKSKEILLQDPPKKQAIPKINFIARQETNGDMLSTSYSAKGIIIRNQSINSETKYVK